MPERNRQTGERRIEEGGTGCAKPIRRARSQATEPAPAEALLGWSRNHAPFFPIFRTFTFGLEIFSLGDSFRMLSALALGLMWP